MGALVRLRNWVREHKKATAGILGGLAALIPERYLPADRRGQLVELAIFFIAGQGVADIGKEKAKIEAASRLATPESERRTPRDMPVQP